MIAADWSDGESPAAPLETLEDGEDCVEGAGSVVVGKIEVVSDDDGSEADVDSAIDVGVVDDDTAVDDDDGVRVDEVISTLLVTMTVLPIAVIVAPVVDVVVVMLVVNESKHGFLRQLMVAKVSGRHASPLHQMHLIALVAAALSMQ